MPRTSSKRPRSPSPEPHEVRGDSAITPLDRIQNKQVKQGRSRGATACRHCRIRRSKCDARHPACSTCERHGTDCVYDNDTVSLCHGVGPQLLEAINNLTSLLQATHSADVLLNPSAYSTPQISKLERRTAVQHDIAQGDQSAAHDESKLKRSGRCGFDSVLTWSPLQSFAHGLPTPVGLCGAQRGAVSGPLMLDSDTLMRLETKYLIGIHSKNPLLEPSVLHKYSLEVSQHGLDESSRSCLVCLVCALGAILGRDPTPTAVPPGPQSDLELVSEPGMAQLFFAAANLRLGNALSENDILAAQCACLTGIWYMCVMEPMKAWKFFSLAGNTWCTASSLSPYKLNMSHSNEDRNARVVERNLYFAIFRSESELRMELDLPNSALEDIELSSSFPQPPEADGSDSHSVSKVDLRSWYYILAEIAVRHILNRLLRFQTRFDGSLDERQILQLFEDADLFTEQLAEWHRLLPPMFHFEEPTGKTLGVESDDMRFVLRYRFMQCRDLIARPFLKICFDELPHKLSLPQQKSVLQRASVCLDVCMLKMTQVRLEWHQGIWYMLRTQAANVAIVLAVALTRHETHATLAQKLRLPEGWKDRIVQVMGKVAPFWTDQNDRLAHMRLVLERGLGAVG